MWQFRLEFTVKPRVKVTDQKKIVGSAPTGRVGCPPLLPRYGRVALVGSTERHIAWKALFCAQRRDRMEGFLNCTTHALEIPWDTWDATIY